MLMLVYFASRIRPQCCMLRELKSEVFIRGGGGGELGGLCPLFLNFLDLPLSLVIKTFLLISALGLSKQL